MASPTNQRKGIQEKNKKTRLPQKSSSFYSVSDRVGENMLPRPRTVPELLAGKRTSGGLVEEPSAFGKKLSKLLVNVTVQRSPGAVQVVLPPEATVEDLIAAVLRQYEKEARRPVLPSADASGFDLHYSQFSLETLDKNEKVVELGLRNFFLCPKKAAAPVVATTESGGAMVASSSSCSKEADKANKKGLPLFKFMNFSL